MTSPLTGGCLCGAIRYTVSAPVTGLRACHCTHCQKASGTGSSVNAVVPGSAFALTQGIPRRYADKADSGRTLYRHFCGDCGSPIYSYRQITPERMVVRAGTFDDSSAMKITTNIWTKSARPWSWIDPASEQLPGNPA
ncbi:MAG: GFA family protein [Pseudomonadota bacterium]